MTEEYLLILCGFPIEGEWTEFAGKAYVEYSKAQFILSKDRLSREIQGEGEFYIVAGNNKVYRIHGRKFKLVLASEERDIRGYGHGMAIYIGRFPSRQSPIENMTLVNNYVKEFLTRESLKGICD